MESHARERARMARGAVSDRALRRGQAAVAYALCGLAAALLLAFLVLPLVALVVTMRPGDLAAGLRDPLVLPALRLSLLTTSASVVLVVVPGTALAWFLAGRNDTVGRWIETAVQLPVVIPPAVGGLALLLALGRKGLLGSSLAHFGIAIPFTTLAVVLAEVFVSAPFFVIAATAAFRRLDPSLWIVARSLGASPFRAFFRVALPAAAPSLIAGGAMSWARSLGEFGATLMFAGNLTGRTQTLPLAVYTALESDMRAAQAISLLLVAIAFALLLVLRRGAAAGGAALGFPPSLPRGPREPAR
jgi:molybdate transport system permease protein